ncbi:MAG: hypothetical protein L6U99_00635 [Clostridium sp.]|nr:MAG: hypothetical protein L6U99_00635 [Clostridium sp.]
MIILKTLKPTRIPVGKVEEAFNKLVYDGREAIIAVSRSQSVLDDIEPQKKILSVSCGFKIYCKKIVRSYYLIRVFKQKNDCS